MKIINIEPTLYPSVDYDYELNKYVESFEKQFNVTVEYKDTTYTLVFGCAYILVENEHGYDDLNFKSGHPLSKFYYILLNELYTLDFD